jgi:hypothetical protein
VKCAKANGVFGILCDFCEHEGFKRGGRTETTSGIFVRNEHLKSRTPWSSALICVFKESENNHIHEPKGRTYVGVGFPQG